MHRHPGWAARVRLEFEDGCSRKTAVPRILRARRNDGTSLAACAVTRLVEADSVDGGTAEGLEQDDGEKVGCLCLVTMETLRANLAWDRCRWDSLQSFVCR